MKKITLLWGIIIILLLIFLIIIGANISKKNKPYKKLENNIVEGMKVYYGQDTNLKKLPSDKKEAKITIAELEAFGIDINNIINNDICDGYGIVTKNSIAFDYKAYIKCDNYTTKNYK